MKKYIKLSLILVVMGAYSANLKADCAAILANLQGQYVACQQANGGPATPFPVNQSYHCAARVTQVQNALKDCSDLNQSQAQVLKKQLDQCLASLKPSPLQSTCFSDEFQFADNASYSIVSALQEEFQLCNSQLQSVNNYNNCVENSQKTIQICQGAPEMFCTKIT